MRRELTEWPDRNHCASPLDEETELSASVKVSWLVTDLGFHSRSVFVHVCLCVGTMCVRVPVGNYAHLEV